MILNLSRVRRHNLLKTIFIIEDESLKKKESYAIILLEDELIQDHRKIKEKRE